VLQKQAKISDAKMWKANVYATLALAARGDKAAIDKAAKLIGDPKKDIREAVVIAIQKGYDAPGNMSPGVAQSALLKPLLDFIDNEPNEGMLTRALHAAAAVRSFE